MSSSLLDEVAPTHAVIDVTFVKIRFASVVDREKFIFDLAYKEVGVARSHFGSHCNTVDLFVTVVVKQLSVRTSSTRRFFDRTLIKKVFECLEALIVGDFSV